MEHSRPAGLHEHYMHYSKFIRRALLGGGRSFLGPQRQSDVAFCVSLLCVQDGQDIRAIYFWKVLFFLSRNSAHVIFLYLRKEAFLEMSQFQI